MRFNTDKTTIVYNLTADKKMTVVMTEDSVEAPNSLAGGGKNVGLPQRAALMALVNAAGKAHAPVIIWSLKVRVHS